MKNKFSIEQFIEKAIKVHGVKYDYSKVIYKNTKTKVKIICNFHTGYEFEQSPAHHLNGTGCPKCAKVYKPTAEEFIKECIAIHGNKYDYSKVVYISRVKKVKILCKIHGAFNQIPADHLRGNNCFKCSKVYKSSNEEFIEKSKELFKDKFNYSKCNYINSLNKITIICNIHGEFDIKPQKHLMGNGGCRGFGCGSFKPSSNEEFLTAVKSVHLYKFDYSKTLYINIKTKIIVICKIHGEFSTSPDNHLNKKTGCPKCGNELTAKLASYSTEEFIIKSNMIHHHKYDYSLVKYTSIFNKILIICNNHKKQFIFNQSAHSHLSGKGCIKCSIGSTSGIEHVWLDHLNIPNDSFHRNVIFKINGRKIVVDGYLPKSNVVYEFLGDFWHGHPIKFPNGINRINKKEFKVLFKNTVERIRFLRQNGFKVISIWESDFRRKIKKNAKKINNC